MLLEPLLLIGKPVQLLYGNPVKRGPNLTILEKIIPRDLELDEWKLGQVQIPLPLLLPSGVPSPNKALKREKQAHLAGYVVSGFLC